jgi:hypothetical protein
VMTDPHPARMARDTPSRIRHSRHIHGATVTMTEVATARRARFSIVETIPISHARGAGR